MWYLVSFGLGAGLGGLVVLLLTRRKSPHPLPPERKTMTAADLIQKHEAERESRLREEAEKRQAEKDPEKLAHEIENRLERFTDEEER